jgi:hypothetical protein
MRRDLERRLQALEVCLYGSPRVAACLRFMETMSYEEFSSELPRLIRHFSLAELELLTKEIERKITKLPASGPSPDDVAV